jgi:hypothetical protein
MAQTLHSKQKYRLFSSFISGQTVDMERELIDHQFGTDQNGEQLPLPPRTGNTSQLSRLGEWPQVGD